MYHFLAKNSISLLSGHHYPPYIRVPNKGSSVTVIQNSWHLPPSYQRFQLVFPDKEMQCLLTDVILCYTNWCTETDYIVLLQHFIKLDL